MRSAHRKEPVEFGQSTRGQGSGLTLFVDAAQPAAAFDHDWVAVHEMSHLFHPYLGDRGSWLAEGLATYYQNVLRARAGLLTPDEAWAQIDAGFDRGRSMTRSNDVTLETASEAEGGHTNFMRTYWSGTAYWLETDLALRRSSDNRLSVDEALRRFDACCLPSYRGWKPDDFVAKLDELLGTDVFRKQFDGIPRASRFSGSRAGSTPISASAATTAHCISSTTRRPRTCGARSCVRADATRAREIA